MPTIFSHTLVAAVAGKAACPKTLDIRFLGLSVLCSVLPDFDVIGFFFGIPYDEVWGHRGFFHSFTFALILGVFVVAAAYRELRWFSRLWWGRVAYFVLLTASHGVLDAFTDGGLGIAFFSPFDNTRYFFPWRPLHVSPIGLVGFLTEGGVRALWSEILWIWIPTLTVAFGVWLLRKQR